MKRRRGKSREQDLDRELRAHLELEAEENRESGMPAAEASYAARRALGNTAYVKEEVREMWGWANLERLRQDVRYGVRTLCHTPVFTAVALVSLALGIGANSAIFSLLNAVVLRLLPVADPQQLVQFTYTLPGPGPDNWNAYFDYPHFERFRDQSRTMSGFFTGVGMNRVSVGFQGAAGLAQCDAYSGSFFSVLKVGAQHGRLFVPADDREVAEVAVLSDRYWRSRFGADPSVVGQAITINEVPFTVIGITPPEFSGIYAGIARDVWVPLHALDRFTPDPKRWSGALISWLVIAGRLRPGVSAPQAEAELDVIHRALNAEQLAAAEGGGSPSLRRLVGASHLVLRPAASGLLSGLRQRYTLPLQLLLGVAGTVLLISCANVANLLLARAAQRRREIALRMALGSGRTRVIRQLLTENLLLAGTGGLLALALAWWGSVVMVRMISTGDTPVPLDVRPDWRVFGFTAAVSLVSGLLFGLAPALRATKVDLGAALKEGTRGTAGSSRVMDRALVAIQVALSLLLITGAGLFTRTVQNLRHIDVGYDRENILMFSADAKLAGYTKERAGMLYRAILEKAAALPGVQSASASIVRPIDDQYYLVDRIREIDSRFLPDADAITVAWNSMSPGYFATVGTPVVLGRDFRLSDDGVASKVVIVNESLARQALPDQNPVGHRLDGAEIIGVVKDSRYNGVRDEPRPVVYRPLFQSQKGTDPLGWIGAGSVSFELRYRAGTGMLDDVRRAVASVDRNVPVFRVKTLRAQTEDSLLRERLVATISSFFGALALLLACLGLYGLMAYAVVRRTAEIGIRMALGARQRGIVWLVLRETLWLVLIGVAAGIPVAVWLTGYAKSLLYGVTAADPVVLAAAVAALVCVAALAGFMPARRASRIDPMVALRYE